MNIGVYQPEKGIGAQVMGCLKDTSHNIISLQRDNLLEPAQLEKFDSLVIEHSKWQIAVGLLRYLNLLPLMDEKKLILVSYKKQSNVKGRNTEKVTLNVMSSQLTSELLLDSLS